LIVLDTNYLVRALVDGTDEASRITEWLDDNEQLCASAISWYEFISGPVDLDGVDLIHAALQGRILPFVQDTAVEAARLFNATGRLRRLRVDAMIAASAILAGGSLATENTTDFKAFAGEGLRLV